MDQKGLSRKTMKNLEKPLNWYLTGRVQCGPASWSDLGAQSMRENFGHTTLAGTASAGSSRGVTKAKMVHLIDKVLK